MSSDLSNIAGDINITFTDDDTRLVRALADPILQIKSEALLAALEAFTAASTIWAPIRRLAAAIDAYEAAMIVPIARAPRDGTQILTFDPGLDTNWLEDFWDTESPGGPDWSVAPESQPTHFRPVPTSADTEASLEQCEAEHPVNGN